MNIIVKRLQLGLLFTNAYIITNKDTRNCVVIDPAFNKGELKNYLAEKNLNLLAVLLTHSHFDHCGGVYDITKDKNIPIYCSEIDAPMTKYASKNRFGDPAEDCEVTNFVSDGETLNIGEFSFKVLATPGHTPGGVCYIIGDYMFTGDTLFAGTVGRVDLPGGDMAKMQESLQKIKKLDRDYFICPGHQETTRLLHELEHNPFLK
ncbi:MAG: MBL fold metallo-hydrolase [Clostridia bacterium]|nr:MBL fold metallo-hydrolase [Clostridia bacterium]